MTDLKHDQHRLTSDELIDGLQKIYVLAFDIWQEHSSNITTDAFNIACVAETLIRKQERRMTLLKDDTQMIIDKLEQADNLLQECRLRLLDCWCNNSACYIGLIQEPLKAAIRKYKEHLRTAEDE